MPHTFQFISNLTELLEVSTWFPVIANRKTSTRLYGDDLVLLKEYINLTANYCQGEQLKHNCAKTKFVSFRRCSSGPKWIVFWKYSKC